MSDAQRTADIHRHIQRILRVRDKGPLPWGTPRGRRADLASIFKDLGYTVGVEIGTWLGDSAKMLCDANPNLALTCIDPWLPYRAFDSKGSEVVYQQAVATLKPYNVTILRTTSMEALREFPDECFDFANIDGDHSFDFVCQDLICWSRKVKRNGMLMVHDYDAHVPGVVKAVDAYTHCHAINPWYVTQEVRHPVTAFWVKP